MMEAPEPGAPDNATAVKVHLHEGLIFNMASLYEFDGALAQGRKIELLRLVGQRKGDGFNPQCTMVPPPAPPKPKPKENESS